MTVPSSGARVVAGWLIAASGLLASSVLLVLHLLRRPWDADFRIFYAAARVGRSEGWSHIYDQDRIRHIEAALGPGPLWAYLNPPPLAWLAAPFSLLDYRLALLPWTLLLVTALAAVTWLALPAIRGPRLGFALGAAAWSFPVVFGVAEGQPTPLLLLGVVAAWRLTSSGRDGLAGVALGLTLLKPHTAWLVPLAFLVVGRPRVLAGYAAVALPIAALSAATLGPAGLASWERSVFDTAGRIAPPLFIFPSLFPAPWAYAVEAFAALLALLAAWRRGASASPALVVAVGLAGSLLAAPYLNLQDLSLLVLAGWLLWPELASPALRGAGIGVLVALLVTPATTILVIPAEAAWLLAALLQGPAGGRLLASAAPP